MGVMPNHPKVPEEELVRMLRDNEGIEIEEGENVKLGEWDFSDLPGLEDDDLRRFEDFAERCKLYLSGSVFKAAPNDKDLGEWRKNMTTKYGTAFADFFIKNKMSGGRLMVFEGDLRDVIEKLDRRKVYTDKAKRIRGLYETFPDVSSFSNLGWDERLKFVRQLENISRMYIGLVTKQP